jgi:hypothetical protein
MDDERIDFASLDPSRDERRWEWTMNSLVAQALVERRQRHCISHQSLRWARPVLAAAAMLSLVAWTAGFWAKGNPAAVPAQSLPTALTLANWAANNQIPETSVLLQTLGGHDGNQ